MHIFSRHLPITHVGDFVVERPCTIREIIFSCPLHYIIVAGADIPDNPGWLPLCCGRSKNYDNFASGNLHECHHILHVATPRLFRTVHLLLHQTLHQFLSFLHCPLHRSLLLHRSPLLHRYHLLHRSRPPLHPMHDIFPHDRNIAEP